MTAQLVIRDLSEEQAGKVLEHLTERGFVGASTTPAASDSSLIDVTVGSEGSDDLAALTGWLTREGYSDHAITSGLPSGQPDGIPEPAPIDTADGNDETTSDDADAEQQQAAE